MRIDAHTHFFPVPFLKEIGRRGTPFEMEVTTGADGVPQLKMHGVPHPDLRPFCDVDEHLRHMKAAGIDMHVVWQSSRPNVFWADPDLGLSLCQIINDEYADLVARHPDRFAAVASVPLQDIDKAIAEAERAVRTKHLSGVMANTNIRGRYLDDPYFWPFYEALEELDVPLFLHPANAFGADKLREFHLSFLLGLPAESALSVARLIFSGTLDRFPKLRLFVPHGGGVLPFLTGRFEHGFKVRPECKKIERRPGEYLDRMLLDSIVYSPDIFQFVVQKAGNDRVALGSDFPYDMAQDDSVSMIAEAGLPGPVADAIMSTNIERFLRIPQRSVETRERGGLS
jgi:aminocarboxymuconate-semialdehyde decarboxylase